MINRFPHEPFDPNGKIFGKAVSVDGLVILPKPNIAGDMDFVITSDNELILGRRHAALAPDKEVRAAGKIKLSGYGRIRRIDNLSGHYQPTVEEGEGFPALLNQLGFTTSGARLQLYEFPIDDDGFVLAKILVVNRELP